MNQPELISFNKHKNLKNEILLPYQGLIFLMILFYRFMAFMRCSIDYFLDIFHNR